MKSIAYQEALKGLKKACKNVADYEGNDETYLHSLIEEVEFQGQQYMKVVYNVREEDWW